MTTKKDIAPTTAQDWLRKFNASALYKHEPSRLFEDYLDLVLCAVANKQREDRYLEVAKRYTREELNLIAELFAWHVLIHEHQTKPDADGQRRWYDLLGDIYMDLAGRSKTSRMGQFFTPVELCTMMARMTLDGETAGKTVSDCCAGSGRMLLAAKAIAPDLGTVYAADLDGICVKMCALNLWLHGIRGEVAHMNSLTLEWYGAYHVHPRVTWPFVTYLDDARKEECHHYVNREQLFAKTTPATYTEPQPPQLDLFSEPEEEYGDPFRPCSLCGCTKSDTAIVLNGVLVEAWEYHGADERILCCPECSAPLRNVRVLRQVQAAEPKVLYGEAKRAHTYLKNDAAMVLDRLLDLHVVLHRHKCIADYTGMDKYQKDAEDARVEQAFVVSKMKIGLELKLRNAELVHDSIKCRIGNMECVFRFTQLPALIRSYRANMKRGA